MLKLLNSNLPKLKIKYYQKEINYGNIIESNLTIEKPIFNYSFENNTFYTLIMFDPDAPTQAHPINSPWLHWLVGNITKDSLGDTLVPYSYASPPKGTGYHKYIFLLLKQKNKINFYLVNENNSIRKKFPVNDFIEKYDLIPIAINYFISKN
jgi:phosphatidylethanolamine-binding protein (PEBP) family uncharacterized protein